jgi:hypothetical protein
MTPGRRRDRPARAFAPGQRHRLHALIGNDGLDPVGADEQRLEHALGGARAAEQILERERALRDVGRVFEQGDVPGAERGRRETNHLPERKVPGHHRQHGAERIEADGVAPVRSLAHHLGGEEALGVRRVVPASGRALLGLLLGRADELPHLDGHETAEARLLALEEVRRSRHDGRALCDRPPAPARERGRGAGELLVQRGRAERLERR